MTCVVRFHSALFPQQPQLHHNEKLRLKKFSELCFLSNNGCIAPLHGPILPLPAPLTRKFVGATATANTELATSAVLTADLPSKAPNPFVFLLTSAVLLFAFWITNFVVPEFISEYLQLDVAEELKNPNNNAEDTSEESPIYTQPSRSRRDFNDKR